MAMKEWFRELQPIQLYLVLILTTAFFITELVVSHITHSNTLLMDSYQMLCNILAMSGCLTTIKYGRKSNNKCNISGSPSMQSNLDQELTTVVDPNGVPLNPPKKSHSSPSRKTKENKLKNTFGWARIDVISMLTCCIFQASLSFSVMVEGFQTLGHISHIDAIHQSLSVLCLGAAGLLLNGVCYLLIGGYTFHQGSFLYITKSGDVVLNRVVTEDTVKQGGRRLSRTRTVPLNLTPPIRERQGFREMCRDVIGSIFVIICALLVYTTDEDFAKYVDPITALLSSICLMFLSYPYMKESCLILLQTIPGSINIYMLKKDLLKHFPDIVNVHDFHVWQLTANKVISTVHIIFENKKGYNKIMSDIKEYFIENGITHVTIQPEFFTKSKSSMENLKSEFPIQPCLMQCQANCKINHCCPDYEESNLNKFKSRSKEINPETSTPDLKSIKVIDNELNNLQNVQLYKEETTESIKESGVV